MDGASGEIYVSNPANGKVYVFASDAPAVTVSEPTGVTKEAASLSGTVDPRGVAVSSCEFEYGLTDELGNGPYNHSVPCKQTPAEIGAGSGPVAVSAQLEGLQPGELYHFRLVATNANGAGETSGLLATQGVGFGIKNYEISFLNENGTPDTQAGSHPYKFVDIFELNSHFKRRNRTLTHRTFACPTASCGMSRSICPPASSATPMRPQRSAPDRNFGCRIRPLSTRIDRGRTEPGMVRRRGSSTHSKLPLQHGAPTRRGFAARHQFLRAPAVSSTTGLLAGGDYPVQATVTDAPATAPVFKSRAELYGVVVPCVRVGREAVSTKTGAKKPPQAKANSKGDRPRQSLPDDADRLPWPPALDDGGRLVGRTGQVGEGERGHAQRRGHARVADGLLEAQVPAGNQRQAGQQQREHVLGADGKRPCPADRRAQPQRPGGVLAQGHDRGAARRRRDQPVGWRWP